MWNEAFQVKEPYNSNTLLTYAAMRKYEMREGETGEREERRGRE
jgi:hypothetical protein